MWYCVMIDSVINRFDCNTNQHKIWSRGISQWAYCIIHRNKAADWQSVSVQSAVIKLNRVPLFISRDKSGKKIWWEKIPPHILLVGNFPDWWDFFSPIRQNFGGRFNQIFIIKKKPQAQAMPVCRSRARNSDHTSAKCEAIILPQPNRQI